MIDLPDTFRPFTTLHAITLVICLAVIAAICLLGRRGRGTPRQARLDRALGRSILLSQALIGVWWLLPGSLNLEGGFNPERSVPLNMCRLGAFIAAAALLLPDPPHRWARALLYFWGLGLSSQAFITPVFPEGPARPVFWVFWLGHTQIVGAAIYDLVVRRYRPTGRDCALAVALGCLYAIVVFIVNWAAGTNYAGLGNATFELPNLAQHLGPWPWRPLWIALIGAAWLVILWKAWPLARRLRSGLASNRPPPP